MWPHIKERINVISKYYEENGYYLNLDSLTILYYTVYGV
jgi:hypothetical protein